MNGRLTREELLERPVASLVEKILGLREDLDEVVEERDELRRELGERRPAAEVRPPSVLANYEVGCVRVNGGGRWYLCNHREKGWASFAYEYRSFAELAAAWAVQLGAPGVDACGAYWATRRPEADEVSP